MKPYSVKINTMYSLLYEGFKLPTFQRRYEWSKFELESFCKELEIMTNDLDADYHLGSIIISKNKNDVSKKQLIIDGQQRCITYLLVVLSLDKIFNENQFKNCKRKEHDLLGIVYTIDEGNILLRELDQKALLEIRNYIDGNIFEFSETNSNLINSFYIIYNYLKSKISNDEQFIKYSEITLNNLYCSIEEYESLDIEDLRTVYNNLNRIRKDHSVSQKIKIYLSNLLEVDDRFNFDVSYNKLEENLDYDETKLLTYIDFVFKQEIRVDQRKINIKNFGDFSDKEINQVKKMLTKRFFNYYSWFDLYISNFKYIGSSIKQLCSGKIDSIQYSRLNCWIDFITNYVQDKNKDIYFLNIFYYFYRSCFDLDETNLPKFISTDKTKDFVNIIEILCLGKILLNLGAKNKYTSTVRSFCEQIYNKSTWRDQSINQPDSKYFCDLYKNLIKNEIINFDQFTQICKQRVGYENKISKFNFKIIWPIISGEYLSTSNKFYNEEYTSGFYNELDKFYSKDPKDVGDIDHQYPKSTAIIHGFVQEEDFQLINGLGNLQLLDNSINRSLSNTGKQLISCYNGLEENNNFEFSNIRLCLNERLNFLKKSKLFTGIF